MAADKNGCCCNGRESVKKSWLKNFLSGSQDPSSKGEIVFDICSQKNLWMSNWFFLTQAAQIGVHFYWFLNTIWDAHTWGTRLRTLHCWRKVGKDNNKKRIKPSTWTHNLLIMTWEPCHCATIAFARGIEFFIIFCPFTLSAANNFFKDCLGRSANLGSFGFH